MAIRKTAASAFSTTALGAHEKPLAAPSLYPRSTPHFKTLFYALYEQSFAPRDDAGKPVPCLRETENEDDWNLFTVNFGWRSQGLTSQSCRHGIEQFLAYIDTVEKMRPGERRATVAIGDDGGSLAFTNPSAALDLLKELVAQVRLTASSTMTFCERNPYNEQPEPQKNFDFVRDFYAAAIQTSPRKFPVSALADMPMKPYVSRDDAAAQLHVTLEKKQKGFLVVELDRIENDVAADCGQPLPHPYAALH